MGRLLRSLGLALVLASPSPALAGCAGEVDEGEVAAAGGAAPSEGPTVVITIKPPILKEVSPFSSVLQLTWETPAPCDEIEGERRKADAMFEVLFTVPGTDTVYVDLEAKEDQTYTYRLRCEWAWAISEYSNELAANPFDE